VYGVVAWPLRWWVVSNARARQRAVWPLTCACMLIWWSMQVAEDQRMNFGCTCGLDVTPDSALAVMTSDGSPGTLDWDTDRFAMLYAHTRPHTCAPAFENEQRRVSPVRPGCRR
jgi:hypothetical protein